MYGSAVIKGTVKSRTKLVAHINTAFPTSNHASHRSRPSGIERGSDPVIEAGSGGKTRSSSSGVDC
jgi:hypothetical protein